jgi:hypothetical protein
MRLGNENLAMKFGGFQATKIEDMDLRNLASNLERWIWPFMIFLAKIHRNSLKSD